MSEEFYLKSMTTEAELEIKNDIELKEENIEENKSDEFFLTALQILLINKKLPSGYKLEFEENYLKSVATENIAHKGPMIGKKRKHNNVSFLL